MRHYIQITGILTLWLLMTASYAKPPFIDYQWQTLAHMTPEACLHQARSAAKQSAFTLVPSTGTQEVVGYKGEYKGVISCFPGHPLAVFIVAGPEYSTARTLAIQLKNDFEP